MLEAAWNDDILGGDVVLVREEWRETENAESLCKQRPRHQNCIDFQSILWVGVGILMLRNIVSLYGSCFLQLLGIHYQ
jgi:hypothetical protein